MHPIVALPDYRPLFAANIRDGHLSNRMRYLRFLGIDIIGRVHLDNRDKLAIPMGSIGKATEPYISTNNPMADIWLLKVPLALAWGWYEYDFFTDLCKDNIYDLEKEGWLFGDVVDHVGTVNGLSWFMAIKRILLKFSAVFNCSSVLKCHFTEVVLFTFEVPRDFSRFRQPFWMMFADE